MCVLCELLKVRLQLSPTLRKFFLDVSNGLLNWSLQGRTRSSYFFFPENLEIPTKTYIPHFSRKGLMFLKQ